MADPNQNLFDRLILAFTVLLGIAKADPDDKLEIKRLKLELDKKTTELGAIRAHAPTPEQEDRLVEILGEFIKAVTPAPEPVTPPEHVPGEQAVATNIFEARDFFAQNLIEGTVLKLADGERTGEAKSLDEAQAFFDAASVPPVPPAPPVDTPPVDTPPADTPPTEPPVAANNQPPPAE